MRLLNVHSRQLEEFLDVDIAPRYAILSHTWGNEEVTFQDLEGKDYKSKSGYRKIQGCCSRAYQDGYDYVWVDTCCIDKKNLTELSEAINSMYRWYSKSTICYVYLADVEIDEWGEVNSSLKNSRWFTRGWTIQELLAPSNIIFFDQNWSAFGSICISSKSNNNLPDIISKLPAITQIDENVLRRERRMHLITAAERLSWAARRQTTRKEDMAYCLLGILGVNMPLLYGEGEMAFIRLQQEYIRQHNDPTLLLWGLGIPCQDLFWRSTSDWALAPSASLFSGFNSHPRIEKNNVPSTFLCTNNGVEVELLLLDLDENMKLACFGISADFLVHYRKSSEKTLPLPLLSSLRKVRKRSMDSRGRAIIALPLLHCPANSMGDFDVYERALLCPPFLILADLCWKAEWTRIYLKATNIRSLFTPGSNKTHREYKISISKLMKGFSLEAAYPPTNIISGQDYLIVVVKTEGYQRFFFAFRGPNNISLGFFIEFQFENSELLHLHTVLGEMSMPDVLHHFLSRGEALSERTRKDAWAELRRKLQGTRDDEVSKFKISGRRLGRPEINYAIVSAHVWGDFNARFRSIKLQWEESRVDQPKKR
ncbi:HET-domain-containing protein [Annulohypoxylon bovei var. microspora]|nr:HET-domain-containing protein [Annulohypoxylon bovei var. microspora]